MENISERMNEFIDKIDDLCFEYGYEIHPTIKGINEMGEYHTISIVGENETVKLIYIDGDGRGK